MTAGGPPPAAADRVLRECARRARRGGSRTRPVADALRLAADRLGEPLRLAVVGQIKRGKSTLVNALLGEQVAVSGQLELTFTVSEFQHGDERAVRVWYKDGSSDGPLPPRHLADLTTRNPAALDTLRRIAAVEYAMPNDLLRDFRLVDTPGLGSVHSDDSRNSAVYLGLADGTLTGLERTEAQRVLAAMNRTMRDVHADSTRRAATADAMVYLFSRGMRDADAETVTRFLGPAAGGATPLRAFGVLSRSDEYWPPGRDQRGRPDPVTYDPMRAAAVIADRYLARPAIGAMFYAILPVAGLAGLGAQSLTGAELDLLGELSRADARMRVRALRDAGRFATEPGLPGIALPAPARKQLIDRLGAWGTHLACQYLHDGLSDGQMRARLVADSGITALRDLIVRHFGNRAAIIKADRSVRDAVGEVARARLAVRRDGNAQPPALDDIATRLEDLRRTDHGTAEVAALGAYYRGELALPGELAAGLLAVTGEQGTAAAARLGLPEGTPAAALRAAAEGHADAWARLENDPSADRATRTAARTIRRSYERLRFQIADSPEE